MKWLDKLFTRTRYFYVTFNIIGKKVFWRWSDDVFMFWNV